MKERPILFKGEMVRAILDGTKTQTRRIVKPQPEVTSDSDCRVKINGNHHTGPSDYLLKDVLPRFACPYGQPGDRLWVRETTCIAPKFFAPPDQSCVPDYDGDLRYVSYKADGHCEYAMREYKLKWTPSIHMPRWASRITLEIVSVRVERLQDITEECAKAEGCDNSNSEAAITVGWYERPRSAFIRLWESINGADSWLSNPWVWVVEFKRVEVVS